MPVQSIETRYRVLDLLNTDSYGESYRVQVETIQKESQSPLVSATSKQESQKNAKGVIEEEGKTVVT